MEKEKVRKAKKAKKRMSKGGLILIIGIIIILIPCVTFGAILLKASMQTGSPVVGSRFDNDLNPAVSSSDISKLEEKIGALNGVEKCTVVLKSAQLRVNVDTKDTLSEDEIKNLTVEAYNALNSTISVDTYFTASDSKKMYDLSINVYNFISEDDTMVYYILTKNSNMTAFEVQCVSKALDEELAADLRGENVSAETDDSAE